MIIDLLIYRTTVAEGWTGVVLQKIHLTRADRPWNDLRYHKTDKEAIIEIRRKERPTQQGKEVCVCDKYLSNISLRFIDIDRNFNECRLCQFDPFLATQLVMCYQSH